MCEAIIESDMDFISDNAFYIEKSRQYTGLGKGIKSVEFIRIINDSLLFVEAKTSFPNLQNDSTDNRTRFNSQVVEICDKYVHSLNLYYSIYAGITDITFPDGFVPKDKVSIEFVLVIKNHKNEWCRRVKYAIEDALPKYLLKIWRPKIHVLNHENAQKKNLIS